MLLAVILVASLIAKKNDLLLLVAARYVACTTEGNTGTRYTIANSACMNATTCKGL